MNDATTVALRIDRPDGMHGFEDPAVPKEWTIERVTEHAARRLRYPMTDASSGKPLRYAMLHAGTELRRDLRVGEAILKRRARVHVVSEYANAR